MNEKDEIAIIGVGGRFPGADNLSEFWSVLVNGENHVKDIPKERWNINAFYDADPNKPGKTYVRKAGFVNSFDEWDHRFFGVSEMEAALMDPQQRLVLECVHMALEDGGITRKQIDGTHTGVYVGAMNNDYKSYVDNNFNLGSAYMLTGTDMSIISARVNYTYNLLGPSLTVNTACSSSLVAVNLGIQALTQGECEVAVCGGVNILMDPTLFIPLSKARMLSPTGQCKTYSADADGYARGEGCGIVILKPLKNAILDGNKIWGTIKTGTNQDGRFATPITSPSGRQQTDLLERIYRSGTDKDKIQVIEAHGTGTPVGDPIESNALGAFFANNKKSERSIIIGSVKSNIGHLESAAGIAGLIKVLLMMKHETIVPSLMYTESNENPKIGFKRFGFIVPTKCMLWPQHEDEIRTACVNSFGFGGTNAHAVVKDYKSENVQLNGKVNSPFIITLSATDHEALKQNVERFCHEIQSQNNNINMSSLSYTTTRRRDHLAVRKAFVVENIDQLSKQCQEYLKLPKVRQTETRQNKIVFVFCGVGTAWNGMCRSLLDIPSFSNAIKAIDNILQPLSGWSIHGKLAGEVDLLKDPLLTHISIFACQIGLVALWQSYGINPDAAVGQSVGEVAAAFSAGKIDLSTAVKIIFVRSKYLSEATGGGMAVVNNIPVNQIEEYCNSRQDKLNIAVFNSPSSCTVAGDNAAIQEMKQHFQRTNPENGIIVDLNVKCAYHSHYVTDAIGKIMAELDKLNSQTSQTAIFSTVTGTQETGKCFSTATYWGDNVRKPVLFSDAVRASASLSGKTLFIEIGPGPVLRAHAPSLFDNNQLYDVLPSVTRGQPLLTMKQAVCKVFEHGCDIHWDKIVDQAESVTEIPQYMFQRQKTLYQDPVVLLRNQGVNMEGDSHLYIERMPDTSNNPQFTATVGETNTPFVYEHFVKGIILVPGAFYADIGFMVGKASLAVPFQDIVVSLEFLRPLRVEKDIQQKLSIASSRRENTVCFRVKKGNTTMCKGTVRNFHLKTESVGTTGKFEIQHKLSKGLKCTHEEFYLRLKELGFEYGDSFHIIKNCQYNEDSCFAELDIPLPVLANVSKTVFHPCILDALFQTTVTTMDKKVFSQIDEGNLHFLPVGVQAIRVNKKPVEQMFVFTQRINMTVLETVVKLHFNIGLFDSDGNTVATLKNYTTYSRRQGLNTPDELKYNLQWDPVLPERHSSTNRRILFVTNSSEKELLQELQMENCVVCHPEAKDITYEDVLSQENRLADSACKFDKRLEAVVAMFDKCQMQTNMDSKVAENVYLQTQKNCWFLVELIRFLSKEDIQKPLFIVTQNTQVDDEEENNIKIDCVGAEVWGFMRSVQLEFIHNQMTLVDLQPSLKETRTRFLDFINSAVENLEQYGTEIKISPQNIYAPHFVKTSVNDLIPKLRQVRQMDNQELSVRSEKANCISDPFLLPLDALECQQKSEVKAKVCLRVKSVYQHPSIIYPATELSCRTESVELEEFQKDGHVVLGVEYVGYTTNVPTSKRFRCSSSYIEPEAEPFANTWERIAVFPTEINSVVYVPQHCTVSKQELPFYQSGLLLNSILSWVMCESVPKHACVIIHSDDNTYPFSSVLERMLITQRNATILKATELHKTNVIVSVCSQELHYESLQQSKHIICFKHTIPANMHKQLIINDKSKITEIDTAQILLPNKIAKLLQKTIPWLKKAFRQTELQHPNFKDRSPVSKKPQTASQSAAMNNTLDIFNLPCRVPLSGLFEKSSTYIITGGLTGLGWELLLLLVKMGAGTVASLSRRSVSPDKAAEIKQVQKQYQCNILCFQADVSDMQALKSTIHKLQNTEGPIRGVFHGAGTLEPALLIKVHQKQFDSVMKPKILGTMNMHIATRQLPLDFFFLQSSITSILGDPGQSNYGAANAFMDSFAKWRRREGLPAQAINWGALEVGMAANSRFKQNFEKRGYNSLFVAEIRSCFQQAIMNNSTEIVYANLEWQLIASDFTNNPMTTRIVKKIDNVIEEKAENRNLHDIKEYAFNIDVETLSQSTPEEQLDVLKGFVQAVAKRILEHNTETYTMSSTFSEIGIDSLSSVTFANVVFDVTRCRIEPHVMLDPNQSLNDIVTRLHDKMFKTKKETVTHKQSHINERL